MAILSLLVKVQRYAAWLLLSLTILYLLTGFVIAGKYGLGKLMDKSLAITLHANMDLPFIALLVLHVGIYLYLDIKRMCGKRDRKKR